MSDDIQAYPDRFDTNIGKFVRIGDLVITSPYKPLSPVLATNHEDLLQTASCRFDLAAVTQAQIDLTTEPRLADLDSGNPSIMHDAGYFSLGMPEDTSTVAELNHKTVVIVGNKSGVYGNADLAGRTLTGKIFQRTLGDDFIVDTEMP